MRGIVFTGNRGAEIRDFPDPHAGPGEAIVKIRASGLCGTDLHFYRGSVGAETISGHEPCGVIEELGAGAPDSLKVGDRVVCHHYSGCGTCELCCMGYEQLCPHRARYLRRRHSPRGQRRLHPSAGAHTGQPSRRAIVRGGGGHLLRDGHRLERLEQDARVGEGHGGRLWAGAGGP